MPDPAGPMQAPIGATATMRRAARAIASRAIAGATGWLTGSSVG